MPFPALILPLLAAAVQPPDARTDPIFVKGHAWAPFISPMGEPFRAHSPTDDTLADWFRQADRNHDGVLTADEMVADAERFFATLDTDHNGEIDPDELAHYEWEIAPDIQVMSRTRRAPGQPSPASRQSDAEGGQDRDRGRERQRAAEDTASLGLGGALQGAARYALLNIPEPVAAADTNFDRSITLEEFRQAALSRFQLLDRTNEGKLVLEQLEALRPAAPAGGPHPRRDRSAVDTRVGNPVPPGD